jgi:nicotinamidase-related amidase
MSDMQQIDYIKAALVIIDPQNCFMDIPDMPLSVVGATADMARLQNHVRHYIPAGLYEQVYITLDTHPADHISHAVRWVDQNGNHPAPFTIITPDDFKAGIWRATDPADQAWQGEYLRRLTRLHCIWPVHGQKGQSEQWIYYPLWRVIHEMGNPNGSPGLDEYVQFNYVEKGMHRDVEQFGVFGADVPFPGAPETDINLELIREISRHPEIVFAGEASSHCVMDSVNQFLANVPEADWKKVVVLRDCMSPVPQPPGGPDFPAMAEFWFAGLQTKGVRVMKVADYEVSKLAA